jgi:hypothetical protein
MSTAKYNIGKRNPRRRRRRKKKNLEINFKNKEIPLSTSLPSHIINTKSRNSRNKI